MSSITTDPAVLVLEDGRVFRGRAYGALGTALGEAVFSTGMTGYQETITDPSYAGQLVVQTAPHIGNTGVNAADAESRRIWVSGYVVRDAARRPSNWRSEGSLDEQLAAQGVVGIQDVDTRAITRHLRDRGAMRGGIFSGDAALRPDAEERLVVAGTANLARSTPDFSSLGPLLDAIEEQVVLLRLFTDDAPAGENRMRVSIGSENNDDALAEASVVTTTYGPGTGEAVAHLGVIGPTRMDYPATMTAVRAVARYLSRFLSPPETEEPAGRVPPQSHSSKHVTRQPPQKS